MGEYNISASQVKCHSQCPKQWEFRYRSDTEPTNTDMSYLNMGSRVHEAIENVIEGKSGDSFSDERLLKSAMTNEYRDLDQYDVPDKLFDTGINCCKTAAKFLASEQPEIRDIEAREEFHIENERFVTGVTGIMDVVTDSEVWDWKTGKIYDDKSENAHKEKIQGATYMAAYLSKYGEPPENIVYVYLKEGKKRTIEPNDETWDYLLLYAEELVKSKESGEFPPKPGDQCYWCGYEMDCPGSKVGVGGVPFDEY